MENIDLNANFIEFIELFISSSNWAMKEFYSVLGSNNIDEAYDRLGLRKEGVINHIKYAFHGSGVYLKFESLAIDIDFLPNYTVGGFDANRLITFYEENFNIPPDYDYHIFDLQLQILEKTGVIKKIKGEHLYAFVSPRRPQ